MKVKDCTTVDVESISKRLIKTIGEVKIERIPRECGLSRRKRDIAPMALLTACLSTLGSTDAHWCSERHLGESGMRRAAHALSDHASAAATM